MTWRTIAALITILILGAVLALILFVALTELVT